MFAIITSKTSCSMKIRLSSSIRYLKSRWNLDKQRGEKKIIFIAIKSYTHVPEEKNLESYI